jgi:hypothetical protein
MDGPSAWKRAGQTRRTSTKARFMNSRNDGLTINGTLFSKKDSSRPARATRIQGSDIKSHKLQSVAHRSQHVIPIL